MNVISGGDDGCDGEEGRDWHRSSFGGGCLEVGNFQACPFINPESHTSGGAPMLPSPGLESTT